VCASQFDDRRRFWRTESLRDLVAETCIMGSLRSNRLLRFDGSCRDFVGARAGILFLPL
jgi:hypothetical protein